MIAFLKAHPAVRVMLVEKTGRFDWDGNTYDGLHEPIVPGELWERVQDVLDGCIGRRLRTRRRDFAFSGLIECGACGCAIVGEIKKERYVYYHCTGYADKCRGDPAACRRKHMREEALEQQFTNLLGRLHFDDDVLEWVRDAFMQATPRSAANTRRRSRTSKPNANASTIVFTRCTPTSLMG